MLEAIAFSISFASFYYQINGGGLGLDVPNNAVVWAIVSFVVFFGSLVVVIRKVVYVYNFLFFCICVLVVIFLLSFFNPVVNHVGWAVRLISIFISIFFVFLVLQIPYNQRSFYNSLYIFIIAFLLHSIVGVVQLFPGFLFDLYIPHTLSRQAVGMFQQRNLLGSLMAVQLVLCIFLYSTSDFNGRSVLLKISIFISLFFSALIIAAVGSRIALLAGFLALIIMIFSKYRFLINAPKLITLTFFFIGGAGFLIGANYTNGLAEVYSKVGSLSDVTSESRYHIYKISWLAYSERPILGHGAEGFQRAFYDKALEYQVNEGAVIVNSQLSHPHNEILYWAVELGVLAVLSIGLIFFRIVKGLLILGREHGLAYFSILIPFLLHSLLELPFYASAYHWILFVFFVSVIIKQCEIGVRYTLNTRLSLLPLIILSAFSVCAFFYISTALMFSNEWRSYNMTGVRGSQYEYMKIHPHYSERVNYAEIKRLAYSEWESNDSDLATIRFRNYLLEKLAVKPLVGMYVDLIKSYAYLGDFDSAYNVASEAFSFYPNNGHLIRTMNFIQKNMKQDFIKRDFINSYRTPPLNTQ